MEDAHAAVLDLQPGGSDGQPTPPDKRMSFFGVYDGHGGEKVAQFAGENVHNIVSKQEAFAKHDFESALKEGFLATDRAILSGMYSLQVPRWRLTQANEEPRQTLRG
jgi:protein phosphatase 2C family protein 2/3